MSKDADTYVKKSFDHVCARCGKDLSYRSASAKYCFDCAKIINREAQKARDQQHKELIARDTVMKPIKEFTGVSKQTGKSDTYLICPKCRSVSNKYNRFCRHCGQRLKED